MQLVLLCCLLAGLGLPDRAAGPRAAQPPAKGAVQEDVQALQGT
jgi:hypothetical protein